MKYLKYFETESQYESFKSSTKFQLPNVSHIRNQCQTLYHKLKKEQPIVLTAKYNAVNDGDSGMCCYSNNDDGNIKSIKIDGNTVQFDPLVNHNSNFEINTVNTVIDWDEWTVTSPDEYLINSKIKSWTIKPKDSSIVLTQDAFDNGDIVYGYVYKEDNDDTKYFDYYNIYTEDIFNEDGSQDYWKEWDFNIASNSLSLSETAINEDWWSYYNCNFVLLKCNYDTEQYEMIDTINEVEYITGGISLDYMFETEGYHEVEIALKENYIGDNIFENCYSLTSITIPDSVTSIGVGAFRGCSSLTSINIPDSVTSIGDIAFESCSSLISVHIGSGITTIGSNAFRNCYSLTSFTIPDSVTSIGDKAFNGCSSLTSVIIGNSVTSIGYSTFINCTSLAEVTIGTGVTTIEFDAFRNCSGLTSITIPDSVTFIGGYAFGDCTGLTEVSVGSGITTIGSNIFYECTSLREITCLATTAPIINYDTFRDIKEAGTLKVPVGSDYSSWMSKNSYYLGKYNWRLEYIIELPDDFEDSVIMTSESNPIAMEICYNQGWAASPDQMLYTESKKVAYIGISFAASNITSFNEFQYFDNLRKINADAFSGCSSLTSIIIPDSVTTIGDRAFYGCTSLPVEDNLRYADTYLVEAVDKTLSTYTIKEGTKWIGKTAFHSCKSLTSIVIPDSVTTIDQTAFGYCSGLTSIVIPNSVTTIERSAFGGCTGLTGITIPDSVTYISDNAFHSCSSLTSIVVSEGNMIYDSRDNCNCVIETTTNTLIQGCYNSVIPYSVTSIGNAAFDGCSNLTSITIPDSVTTIGDSAFRKCESLTSIVIPDSVTKIGYLAFADCYSLTSITIPDSVTSIGEDAFVGCEDLTSVHIGSGVTSIGNETFWDCFNLNEITCNAVTAPTIYNNTFKNVKQGGILKVPVGSDYSSWMSTGDYYLGKYNWTVEYIPE